MASTCSQYANESLTALVSTSLESLSLSFVSRGWLAGDARAHTVIGFGDVHDEVSEAHLLRRGMVAVLVGRHFVGRADQVLGLALFELPDRADDWTARGLLPAQLVCASMLAQCAIPELQWRCVSYLPPTRSWREAYRITAIWLNAIRALDV